MIKALKAARFERDRISELEQGASFKDHSRQKIIGLINLEIYT
jgi:hypothetical protein